MYKRTMVHREFMQETLNAQVFKARSTYQSYYHLRIFPIGLYANYINENIPIAHFY